MTVVTPNWRHRLPHGIFRYFILFKILKDVKFAIIAKKKKAQFVK